MTKKTDLKWLILATASVLGQAPGSVIRIAVACCLVIGGAAALTGCGGQNRNDIEAYLDQIRAQPGGDIPPIPEVKAYQPFEYPKYERDPFDAGVIASQLIPQQQSKSSVSINANRSREYLESFPLDSLLMVGTLKQKGHLWALIKTPDGTVQRISRGNYIGENHGKITKISETGVELIEIVPDGFGGYMEQSAAIALHSQ